MVKAGAAAKIALDYKTTETSTTGTWVNLGTEETGSWYWADAVTEHKFYACYPAIASAEADYTAVEVPDIAIQKDEEDLNTFKKDYEFMFAQSIAVKKESTVALPMKQIFAAVQFNVKLKAGAFADNSASMTLFTLTSTNPVVNGVGSTLNLIDGALTNGAAETSLAITPTKAWPLNNMAETSVAALVLPNEGEISVTFTVGGKVSEVKKLSPAKYEAGKVYTFDVELSAALQPTLVGDVSIAGWSDVTGTPITPVVP